MKQENEISNSILRRRHDRIGPNAVTQIVKAAHDLKLDDQLERIFISASAYDWFKKLPDEMVDEHRVALLHRAVRANLSEADAHALLQKAGELTGAYILENRIPNLVKFALSYMSRRIAAYVLTKAIKAHAWTFAGSGRVTADRENDLTIHIADNPLCRHEVSSHPVCVWHEAVFTTLYRALASPETKVREIRCQAVDAPTCVFRITI